jgi:glucose-6-phosphate 1-epimerase
MLSLSELNEQYGIPNQLQFTEGNGGLTFIKINNEHATAVVSLYGAQVLSFVPKGQEDLLWMSSQSLFEEGKAIRGGIPLCFPWFGPHPSNSSLPQHGFARLQYWDVSETALMANGATHIKLSLHQTPASLALWPYSFSAYLVIIAGQSLEVKLHILNTDTQSFSYSDALHTYLKVSDVSNIKIAGLHQGTYYDAFGTELKEQLHGHLTIEGEVNRRYVNHVSDCMITDTGFNRNIHVAKSSSNVTVVWNPGAATSKTISDMTDDGYKDFVCVEAVNAYPGIDMITLAPAEEFTLSTTISL